MYRCHKTLSPSCDLISKQILKTKHKYNTILNRQTDQKKLLSINYNTVSVLIWMTKPG